MASWVPHGLIQNQDLEESYQNARQSVDSRGDSNDPKELCTVHLFEDLFRLLIFPRPDFKINSLQPPSDKDERESACDLAIKYVDDIYHWHTICFVEAKRARNTTKSKIEALELQAEGYCKEIIEAHPDTGMVYACTLVGASIRCWTWTKGDLKLRGVWDGDEKDHFEFYRDIGLEENKVLLEDTFNNIKSILDSKFGPGGQYYHNRQGY